jgi:hypothetical protein
MRLEIDNHIDAALWPGNPWFSTELLIGITVPLSMY